jgi:preprotein translocase subunit SecD
VNSTKKKVWFISALLAIAIVFLIPSALVALKKDVPESWPADEIKLGLDLKGGLYLSYEVITEEAVKSQLASMALGIKSDVNREDGGAVLHARQVGIDEIEVIVLGVESVSKLQDFVNRQYRDLRKIQETPTDGMRIRVSYRLDQRVVEEIQKNSVEQAIETIRNRVDQTGVREPVIQRQGERRLIVQLPDVDITEIDLVKESIGSVAKLEFQLVSDPTTTARDGIATIRLPLREGGEIELEEDVLMTGDAIERADVEIDTQTNQFQVTLKLNSVGARTFDRITSRNVGRQLAIVLDGIVQSAPRIISRIGGGTAAITGDFTPQEARLLKIVLQAGALPAPLKPLEQRLVGATLGADSVKKGVSSLLIGSLCVVAFAVIYYQKAGLLAVAALTLNVVFLLSLLAMLGATLTLPGIAGLVLTVGMAIDANIIIFERIREEIRVGATPRAAIDSGFLKAHWTILDANITTLIIGMVLYAFGTGPVKGFAVTLCLGIITSLFTALFVAKVGFELFNFKNKKGTLSI